MASAASIAATEASLEILSGSLDAALRARAPIEAGDFSFEAVSLEISTINRLLDAAVECGMDIGHADLIGWSSSRVAKWLCSAGETV